MDTHLDTLSDELCQVNTRVGHIARQQARLGGFVEFLSPSLEASEDKDDDDDFENDKLEESLTLCLLVMMKLLLELLTLCHS